MAQPTIFLDDGGVMNDNTQRGPQWQRLVSEFFPPILGGSPEAWMEANYLVVERILDPDEWKTRLEAATSYQDFDHRYQCDWLGGMCELVGLPTLSKDRCLELAYQANAFITPRVHTAFPGVVEAIRTLQHQGYTLHTASGEPSTDLAGYLEGMGVRECFGSLYGPDLIDTFKNGPEYYERLLADAGIAPADALIVDDTPRMLRYAREVGTQTVLITSLLYPAMEDTLCLPGLNALPEALQQIARLTGI